MASTKQIAMKAALEFYIDNGVDVAVNDEVIDKTQIVTPIPLAQEQSFAGQTSSRTPSVSLLVAAAPNIPLGKSDAKIEAIKLAQSANTLDELKQAIADFDGISIKKTATNLVFADGNPKSKIMVIGEAPGADEDRQGRPFVGSSGQLLDKILGCIDLSRSDEDPLKSAYIADILNWRPPGNRTPSPAEIEVSLPFIERHIQLVQPEILLICGAVAAKALLGKDDSISRLRKAWHAYIPQTQELAANATEIQAIVTYHPAYLLRTPAHKRGTWADILMLNEKRKALNLLP